MDEGGRCNEASSSSLHDADSSMLTEPAVCNSSLSTSIDSHVGDYEIFESSGKENVSLQQDLGLDRQQLEGTQIIAKGIASVVGPVIRDFDSRAEGALKSQGVLKSSIDRLTRELDTLLEDAPLPFITQHATKLSGVRKRVSSLSSTLQTIQSALTTLSECYSDKDLRMLQVQGRTIRQCLITAVNILNTKMWMRGKHKPSLMIPLLVVRILQMLTLAFRAYKMLQNIQDYPLIEYCFFIPEFM